METFCSALFHYGKSMAFLGFTKGRYKLLIKVSGRIGILCSSSMTLFRILLVDLNTYTLMPLSAQILSLPDAAWVLEYPDFPVLRANKTLNAPWCSQVPREIAQTTSESTDFTCYFMDTWCLTSWMLGKWWHRVVEWSWISYHFYKGEETIMNSSPQAEFSIQVWMLYFGKLEWFWWLHIITVIYQFYESYMYWCSDSATTCTFRTSY